MHTFKLVRDVDESGVSGTGTVAEGVRFTDGSVALHWLTEHASTGLYNTVEDVRLIHGHGGKTRLVWDGELSTSSEADPFHRGRLHCVMDQCENAPFATIGGLSHRIDPVRPSYVSEMDWPKYLDGYKDQAFASYGQDWRTCEFGWGYAFTINQGEITVESEVPAAPIEVYQIGPKLIVGDVEAEIDLQKE